AARRPHVGSGVWMRTPATRRSRIRPAMRVPPRGRAKMIAAKREGATPRGASPSVVVAASILVLAAGAAYAQGLTGMLPFFPPGEEVTDAVKAHYHFKVVANQSPGGKILFGSNRFYGTGAETYLIENNFYSNGLLYGDPVCT